MPNPSRGIRTHVGISVTERLFNQASQVLYPGGTVNQLSYDGFGRLSQLKYKSPSQQTLLQRNYQYDPMSNITRVDENKLTHTNNTSSTSNTANAYLYQYDKLYRLTNADNPSGYLTNNTPMTNSATVCSITANPTVLTPKPIMALL